MGWDSEQDKIRLAAADVCLSIHFSFFPFFFSYGGFCSEDHSLMLATDKYGLLGNRYSIRPLRFSFAGR